MMEFLSITGVILFVAFFFGFCIFIHELGHFLAAKWRGLHIVAFSIGFKKIWCKKINGVEYRIGWIPFGGYVDLPQIDSTEIPKDQNGKELPKAKPLDKIITAFAGPFFNILFGFALACVVWGVGVPLDTPKMRFIEVAYLQTNGPEYEAGLREGDKIVKIDGRSFYKTWGEFARDTILASGKINLTVERDGRQFDINYVLKANPEFMASEEIGYPFFAPKIPVKIYPLPGAAAEKAGLKADDEIIAINDKPVRNHEDFISCFRSDSDISSMNITLLREGKKITIENLKPEVIADKELNGFKTGIMSSNEVPVTVLGVIKASAAEQAGIKTDDIILSANGRAIDKFITFKKIIDESNGVPVKIKVQRDGKEFEYTVKPRLYKHYTIGVQLVYVNHPNPWEQFVNVIDMSVKTIKGIFSKESTIKPKHLSGPLGIVRAIGKSVYYGSIMHGINIIVLITFSLGLINLFPLPVLDGGHITIAVIESIIRRPLPAFIIQPLTYIFVVLLISFMIFVTFFDMRRYYDDFKGEPKKASARIKPSVPKSLSEEPLKKALEEKAGKNVPAQEDTKN